MSLVFSRRLAVMFGVLLPIVETIRRWRQLGDLAAWPSVLPAWLDDLILGALLLTGAWLTRAPERGERGRRFLAAAWGVTCGMGYASFFDQVKHLDRPDPAPIASSWVALIKGVGLVLAIAALVATLRSDSAARADRGAAARVPS